MGINITDIRIRLTTDSGSLKAVASVTINDCFAVHDMKVIEHENGLFISMPSKKEPDGTYKDICHPINTETRNAIQEAVIQKYNEVKAIEEENFGTDE